jgi:hypothetical protein
VSLLQLIEHLGAILDFNRCSFSRKSSIRRFSTLDSLSLTKLKIFAKVMSHDHNVI